MRKFNAFFNCYCLDVNWFMDNCSNKCVALIAFVVDCVANNITLNMKSKRIVFFVFEINKRTRLFDFGFIKN